jgi:hypothetical protein
MTFLPDHHLSWSRAGRIANLVAVLGDSRAAAVFTDSARRRKGARSPLNYANAMLGQPLDIGPLLARSGARTDEIIAQVAGAIGSRAGLAYIWMGVNSIAQNVPSARESGAAAAVNTIAVCKALRAVGMRVIVEAEIGAANFTATQVTQVSEMNDRLAAFARRDPGVLLHDARAAVCTAGQGRIAFRPGFGANGTDPTHEGALGAFVHGRSLMKVIDRIFPAAVARKRHLQASAPNTLVTLKPSQGGGRMGKGVTGEAPAGFTAECTGEARAEVSLGDGVLMRGVFSAAGEVMRLRAVPSVSSWDIGDVLMAECSIEIVGRPEGLLGASLEWLAFVDGAGHAVADLLPIVGDRGPVEAHALWLRTRPYRIAGRDKGYLNFDVVVRSSGAGAVTAIVRHARLVRISG